MNSGSSKRSREVIPSYSSGKPVVARTGALIGRPVEQPRSYERITKAKYEDKQTGSYERYTTKEKASSGERHVERGSRQVGVRDEYKKSSSVKVGDKSGYTEYQVEERVRRVDFGRGSITNGPNNYASYKGDSVGYSDDDGDYETGYAEVNAAPSHDCDGGYSDDNYY
ncbi:hypothetical protein Vadar_031475 [Vaccinium darrowii]|uniref:Uncharacterized protein n=1 Tax=Vaccinium darrowii TaxID=229202 RepID=A0ACB7YQS5_9ERIC|nr:hypothetical protein Vadar_031475 [Vaccinium darrowii]